MVCHTLGIQDTYYKVGVMDVSRAAGADEAQGAFNEWSPNYTGRRQIIAFSSSVKCAENWAIGHTESRSNHCIPLPVTEPYAVIVKDFITFSRIPREIFSHNLTN